MPEAWRPAATTRSFAIPLQDFVGNALADTIHVPTFNDCARNLILANPFQNK